VFADSLRHAVEQRQFVVKNFKHFSHNQNGGANSTENIIMDEVYKVEEQLRLNIGRPMRTMTKFNAPLVNSFWGLLTGKIFKHDDAELNRFSTFVAQ